MAWLWDNIVGVITTVLAIYGAVLSSLNFWHMRKRDKKELYIEANFIQSSYVEANIATITVVNKSLRPITIKEIGLKYDPSVEPKLSKPVDYENDAARLPAKLETSDQFSYDVPCCYFANEKEKFHHFDTCAVPYAIDNEGQKYNGTPLQHPIYFVLGS
ncbi:MULTISPECIES: hypothetical protein [Bartonella]|uniref:hypothetical protein n=1 Tax=Bartonella TaxID=773 RepID=UPI0018DE952A|nr:MULTISPECIES: hypothetical protein [Bartonella]MBI0168981.1 hypothetical protein [Bartonella sp. W8167]MBI0175031.1 hypothetical protein [Bartonella apis]